MAEQSTLRSLIFRFGRIYFRACDGEMNEAKVLYTLSTHGKPQTWLPIFAGASLQFLEVQELLLKELSPRQIHIALTGLRKKNLIHQAHFEGKAFDGNPDTVITDEGVDIATLPTNVRMMICRHPLPAYFVQVDHIELLRRAQPDLEVLLVGAIADVRRIYDRDNRDYADGHLAGYVFSQVYSNISKWGGEPFYTPSSLKAVIMTLLEQHLALPTPHP